MENAAALARENYRTDIMELASTRDGLFRVLHSRNDQAVPIEECRQMSALIRDAHFITLTSTNHISIEGDPAGFEFWEESSSLSTRHADYNLALRGTRLTSRT